MFFGEGFDLRWPITTAEHSPTTTVTADGELPFGYFDLGTSAPMLAQIFVFTIPVAVLVPGTLEVWVLWRHRDDPIAHGPRKYSWWHASVADQKKRGILIAGGVILFGYTLMRLHIDIVTGLQYLDDPEWTIANVCFEKVCSNWGNHIAYRLYGVVLLLAMVVSCWWVDPLVTHRRDLPAGLLLSVLSSCFVGVFAELVRAAYDSYRNGFGVLGVQVLIEAVMMLVFMWARSMAGRAFRKDASGEAKVLIWCVEASSCLPVSCALRRIAE